VSSQARLLPANATEGLPVFILATLIAELEVEGKVILFVLVHVRLVLDVFGAKEGLSAAADALEAIGTLPVTGRHLDQLRLQAPQVVSFVADRTDQESFAPV